MTMAGDQHLARVCVEGRAWVLDEEIVRLFDSHRDGHMCGVPSDGPAAPARRTLAAVSNDSDDKRTDSGIVVRPLYTADDLVGWDAAAQLGTPGAPPYTRGVYPTMYRGKLWTMRQYAGFGSAASTNERFKFLLEAGQTGLRDSLTG